jgi:hypothetical protein
MRADCFDSSIAQGRLCCGPKTSSHLGAIAMSTVLERKSNLNQLVLECILMDNGIPLSDWAEWFDLVYYGIAPSFSVRHCKGGAKALEAILKALSDEYFKEKGIRFPPKGWKPSRKQLAKVA